MANKESILVVGSIAFDSVRTPAGSADRVLGGSLNYFSIAASNFSPVHLVGVVGEDFPESHVEWLRSRGIDCSGLKVESGKTFYWKGEYSDNLNEATTIQTDLNVFENFNPQLAENQKNCSYVFLANIDPVLQENVLNQMREPKLVALDTMNFWINGPRVDDLKRVLKRIDILIVNEMEASLLSGVKGLKESARAILEMGPKAIAIKRGDLGAGLFSKDREFIIPALPVTNVKDPTGAGDTFAAGFLGYLSKSSFGRNDISTKFSEAQKALIHGSVMASFTIEDFSFERLKRLEPQEISSRVSSFAKMISTSG